jgi:hypothetical protein
MRSILTSVISAALISLSPAASAQDIESGRAQAARALLERAVNELRGDRAETLAKINAGENAFKGDGLRLFCANADGKLIAHRDRSQIGQDITALRDRTGKAYGQEFMQTAAEGRMSAVDYVLIGPARKCGPPPRVKGKVVPTGCPGIRVSVPTRSIVTRVGDLVCGVEFTRQNAQRRGTEGRRRRQ